MTVIGKGNKERTVYLNQACKMALNEYMRVRPKENLKDKNALFLSERKQRISSRTVQVIVKKYLGLAGLDTNKYSPHKLRHSCITKALNDGVPIQVVRDMVGHTNIQTTNRYSHSKEDEIKRAMLREDFEEE